MWAEVGFCGFYHPISIPIFSETISWFSSGVTALPPVSCSRWAHDSGWASLATVCSWLQRLIQGLTHDPTKSDKSLQKIIFQKEISHSSCWPWAWKDVGAGTAASILQSGEQTLSARSLCSCVNVICTTIQVAWNSTLWRFWFCEPINSLFFFLNICNQLNA